MAGPNHVLVPTLGKPGDREALEYALERFPAAEVTVLSVVTPLDEPMSEGGVLERGEERRAQADSQITALLESVAAESAEIETRVLEGKPGTVVPRYAGEHGVDRVVLSGTETSGLLRRLLGRDVATTVSNRTAVPVDVVE